MTPRENMNRAIEFRRPQRLPVHGFGDENTDVIGIGWDEVKPAQAQGDSALDQWLCRWSKTDIPNMGQVTEHPLADLSAMKDYPWPDGSDPRRYFTVPPRVQAIDADPVQRDKYCCPGIFMLLWERMHSLRGFENCMIDLMDDRPEIHEIADRIIEYDIRTIRSLHRLTGDRINGFGCSEDWGTQADTHISPELWRKFFFPRYRRIFGAVHECGWHMWMHSCGRINKIIPGLIEAGLDVVNMQQPRTNGIDEIGRQFAGKICFETLCDIQKTLPRGDRAEIQAEAGELLRKWGTPRGGFILCDYGDPAAIGVAPETKQFMLETFRRLDPWKTGWDGAGGSSSPA